ncbi:MAG TPA: hypothetical protein VEP90_08535 [Methylomirabilota bacterium]|nr:hypothetical protein [Methylomirabilota bacterium]
MPQVVDKVTGKVLADISSELLSDFFDEIFIEGKSLFDTLADYNTETRYVISEYIVCRLAEVDPGYLPTPMVD